MSIRSAEILPAENPPQPNLACHTVTDVNSVCRGIISFLRSHDVDIPKECPGGACLKWKAQEEFDRATVKLYLPILMGRDLLDRLKAIPPQSSPEPTAF